eukprot:g77619.t1
MLAGWCVCVFTALVHARWAEPRELNTLVVDLDLPPAQRWTEPRQLNTLVVDLDLPPAQRWTKQLKQNIQTHTWEYSFQPLASYWDSLPAYMQQFMAKAALDLEQYFPGEYAVELMGMAAALQDMGYGDELPLQEILALNLIYEWTSLCTSIVSVDEQGNMLHARNMDWSFANNSFYNISALVHFQSRGKTVYMGVQWLLYVGVLSGASKHFSLTIDQRTRHEAEGLRGNIRAMTQGAWSVAQLGRTALSKCTDWTCALSLLSDTYVAAPVYYILSGTNTGQGAVLTRDREGATTDVWKLGAGPQRCCPDVQDWYLLQTNFDHWRFFDGVRDDRQRAGIANMNSLGQAAVSCSSLLQSVLYQPPTLQDSTQYSMVLQTGELSSFQAWGWQ